MNLAGLQGPAEPVHVAAAGLWYGPGPCYVSCSITCGTLLSSFRPSLLHCMCPHCCPHPAGADMLLEVQSWQACHRQHPSASAPHSPTCCRWMCWSTTTSLPTLPTPSSCCQPCCACGCMCSGTTMAELRSAAATSCCETAWRASELNQNCSLQPKFALCSLR